MRILYFTGGFPYPLTSGYLRHYHFIRELSQQHEITLASLVGPSFVPEHAQAMSPYTKRVLTVRAEGRGRSVLGKTEHALRAAVTKGKDGTKMRAVVDKLLATERYDVVLFSGRENYAALEDPRLPPIVVDFTDASWVRIRLQMQVAPKYKAPGLWYKYWWMRLVEYRLLEVASHGVFASHRDLEALADGPLHDMSVVPNGVDFDYWSRRSPELGRNTLIFTGAMNYAPNVDAALYLIEDVLPLVRLSVPDVKLLVVGHSPKPTLVAAGRQPGVTVTGFVEDVRPYLERASLFVAPLRFGAGIQNKVLEAMSMKVPVVASTLAAEGLITSGGEAPPIAIADQPADIARLIVAELQRQDTDSLPSEDMRRYVMRHFDWQVSANKLHEILQQTVGVADVSATTS